MKKITLLVLTSTLLFSCCKQDSVTTETTEKGLSKIDLQGGGKLVQIIEYKNTPGGISILTLPDGKRFLYCETSKGGVCVLQILETNEHSLGVGSITE